MKIEVKRQLCLRKTNNFNLYVDEKNYHWFYYTTWNNFSPNDSMDDNDIKNFNYRGVYYHMGRLTIDPYNVKIVE